MFEQTFETSANPYITVTECWGDLVVRGSEEQRIILRPRGGADNATMEQDGESFTLVAQDDCFLTCPAGTSLTVHTARNNLKVRGVKGPITVATVHGNVTLDSVGATALEQVGGNLRAGEVAGNLESQTVRGNARIYGVEGHLSMRLVAGNLKVEGLQGGLEVEQVGGNVRLGSPFSPGATYRLCAGGNLRARIPEDASLRLRLEAGGRVRSLLPDLALEEQNGQLQGVLGAGEAGLEAQVGGNVTLRPLGAEGGVEFEFEGDLDELGSVIEAQIAEAMAGLEARLEGSLGRMDSAKVRLRVEKAADKARRKAEQAAERARLRAERAERRWRRVSGRRPPRPPATDEERMRVLRLVEEGKVTPEQAADLLAALEGR